MFLRSGVCVCVVGVSGVFVKIKGEVLRSLWILKEIAVAHAGAGAGAWRRRQSLAPRAITTPAGATEAKLRGRGSVYFDSTASFLGARHELDM